MIKTIFCKGVRVGKVEILAKVPYASKSYHFEAVMAVEYNLNLSHTNDFRKWATQTLNEFIIKGFVWDDERFQQGINFDLDFLRNCWNAFVKSETVNLDLSKNDRSAYLEFRSRKRKPKDLSVSDQNMLQFHTKLAEIDQSSAFNRHSRRFKYNDMKKHTYYHLVLVPNSCHNL